MSRFAFAVCLTLIVGCSSSVFAGDEADVARVLQHRMVSIEVSIVELAEKLSPTETLDADSSQKLIARIRELEAQGKLAGLTRVRLSTLENNITSAQTGEQLPVVSGRALFGGPPGRGGPTSVPTYEVRRFGTMVTVVPRIEPGDTIVIEVQIEKSNPMRDTRPANAEGDPSPSGTSTIDIKSTIRVANGQTIIVQANGTSAGETANRTVVLLTAHAEPPLKTAGAKPTASRGLRIFRLESVSAEAVSDVLQILLSNRESKFAIERITNTVIVQGTQEELEIVGAILQKLDQPPARKPVGKEKAAE